MNIRNKYQKRRIKRIHFLTLAKIYFHINSNIHDHSNCYSLEIKSEIKIKITTKTKFFVAVMKFFNMITIKSKH